MEKPSKIEIKDKNYAISNTYSLLKTHSANIEGSIVKGYVEGSVITKYGSVKVYSQGYGGIGRKMLIMRIVAKGREYHRTISGKVYTDIGISRKAAAFAKEIDALTNPLHEFFRSMEFLKQVLKLALKFKTGEGTTEDIARINKKLSLLGHLKSN